MKTLIIFLILTTPCYATDFFVKTLGDDTKDGLSDANAWETVAKVESSSFNAGDNIQFNKGDSWAEGFVVPSSGNSGGQITFTSYGTGNRPILSGDAGKAATISTFAKSFISIDGIQLQGGTANVVGIRRSNDIIIDDCEVDNGVKGIAGFASNNFDIFNITIQNSNIHDNSESGIFFNTGDTDGGEDGKAYTILIDDNTIHTNTLRGIQINSVNTSGGTEHFTSDLTITNNDIYNNDSSGMAIGSVDTNQGTNYIAFNKSRDNGVNPLSSTSGGLGLNNVSFATIEFNEMFNNSTKAGEADGCGIFLDWDGTNSSNNCIVRNNTVYNHDSSHNQIPWDTGEAFNSSGICMCCGVDDNQVYNNISFGNAVGLSMGDLSGSVITSGNLIYNNAFIGNRIGIQFDIRNASSTGNIIKNNIIQDNLLEGDGVTDNWGIYAQNDAGSMEEDFDLVFNNETETFNFTQGANNVNSDATFRTNSKAYPESGSPAINEGTTLTEVEKDFRGKLRNDGSYDIGAYEFGGVINKRGLTSTGLTYN